MRRSRDLDHVIRFLPQNHALAAAVPVLNLSRAASISVIADLYGPDYGHCMLKCGNRYRREYCRAVLKHR